MDPAAPCTGPALSSAVKVTSPITVEGIVYPAATVTYTAGGTNYTVKYTPTSNVRVGAGTRLQYGFDMKQFWTIGLAGIQAYANAAYGGNFDTCQRPIRRRALAWFLLNDRVKTARLSDFRSVRKLRVAQGIARLETADCTTRL